MPKTTDQPKDERSGSTVCSGFGYARLLVEATKEAADRCRYDSPRWSRAFNNDHEGVYCSKCAEKLFPDDIDGCDGWVHEEDSPPFCESCGTALDFILTDYGVEEQLAIVEEYGIKTDHDAYCVHRMMNAGGHPLLTESCGDWDYKPEWKPRIEAIYNSLTANS